MTHIAMFDAISTFERDFEPYHVRLRHWNGGSPVAAAAQAAHDVLVAINPAATATYDAALVRQLGSDPSGFVRHGAEAGADVAREILSWRQNDGWVVSPFPPYSEPPFPGLWQRTPPANAAPAFTHLQGAAPLAVLSATQYLPPPPPALTSERYATDFNEVKQIGKSDSAVRTAEQTAIARLWAGTAASGAGTATNYASIWNTIARDAATDRGLSLIETARVFALLNVSVHDALQTAQTSKFVYGLWRPVTAIRQADTDLNAATDPDPTWLPLLPTPPYPSYAGNMSTIGAAAARALQLAFGTNDMPVRATWHQSGGQPDVIHEFPGFWEAAQEQADSRIYGGIHYQFDHVAGQQIGRGVLQQRSYVSQQALLDATQPKGRRYYWKSEYLRSFDPALFTAAIEHASRMVSPHSAILIFPIDGAMNELPEDHSAVGNRDAAVVLNVAAAWERASDDQPNVEWARNAWRDLRQFSTGGTYVNFLTEEEGDDRTRAAYRTNYPRLAQLKAAWDPENLFHTNKNIGRASVA